MKELDRFILEKKGDPIDDQWINDGKPVMTADGRPAIISEVDRSKVPNVIKGKVNVNNSLHDFTWLDDGSCVTAVDSVGNAKMPDDDDALVKAS